MRYQVIDSKTGNVVGTYRNFRYATNRADQLDWEYGAVRYYVKRVKETPQLRDVASSAPRA